MTDKPMDVERTLRELSERAAPRPWTLSDDNHGWPTVTDGEGKFLFKYEYAGERTRASMAFFVACVNLEALREPGAQRHGGEMIEETMRQPELDSLAKEFCLDDERVEHCSISIERKTLRRLIKTIDLLGMGQLELAHKVCMAEHECSKLQDYTYLLERGLGSHEARETVWPESRP